MDPSIQSALTDQILKAKVENERAIANWESFHHSWEQSLPIYAACRPPVTPPAEPPKPQLRSVDSVVFERIYVEYNSQRTDIGSKGGDLDITPAFTYTTYEPAPVVVAGPPKQPKNPLGVCINEEEDWYAPAIGDVLPAGTIYPDNASGNRYRKVRVRPVPPANIPSFKWVPFEG